MKKIIEEGGAIVIHNDLWWSYVLVLAVEKRQARMWSVEV